ncbi:cell division protein ZapD [Vibrio rumoiensis]|uniref:Cell division protein ZapD n=1 Tax=Vibrio rumoiensis 1S-45 TaxID=1188252 RepID=A0A1E5E1F3_9VIBR|nr:cell division protein ZapD [Vibrio rumoiensis 1S-45]
MLKFEHPLTEKARIYLRVEALMGQLHKSASFEAPLDYQLFFRSLFDLLDLFEQIHIKSELTKDLEKQKLTFKNWVNVPGVDQAILNDVLNDIDDNFRCLMSAERLGQSLKDERFLSAIRQRFSLPGGTCCFDLPSLHYWLHLPLEKRLSDAKKWTDTLKPMNNALDLLLKLIREIGRYKPQVANNGFFQSEADEANILRLQVPLKRGVYPMISGHKNRFAIKFMNFETGMAYSQDVEFDLAIC